jgi:hypothetical protein
MCLIRSTTSRGRCSLMCPPCTMYGGGTGAYLDFGIFEYIPSFTLNPLVRLPAFVTRLPALLISLLSYLC